MAYVTMFKFLYKDMFFERERQRGGSGSEGQKILSRFSAWRPMKGLIPDSWDHDSKQNHQLSH